MKYHQGVTYQLSLFPVKRKDITRPYSLGESRTETKELKAKQVNPSGNNKRILTESNFMVQILDSHDLKVYKSVKKNKEGAGVYDMDVKALKLWRKEYNVELILEHLQGESLVKGMEIDKPEGGIPQISIPTVKDRLILQAIHQALSSCFEQMIRKKSYVL